MCIGKDTTVYVFVKYKMLIKIFWTWNKIATLLLYIQIQYSLNKTPHSQKYDLNIISAF